MNDQNDIIPISKRDQVRAAANAEAPPSYSPWFHLFFPTTCAAIIVAACIYVLRDFHAWQLGLVPLALIAINAAEWLIHKHLLHHRTPGFTILYDRHTPMHHVVFTTDDMAIRSWRELRMVLIPPFGIFGVLFAALPFYGAFALLAQPNLGLLFVAVMMTYAVIYEWLHMSYHLPPESAVGRNRAIRWLRRHHAAHHDPRLMQRWNFNVTIPLWDWVAGTSVRGREKQRALRQGHVAR
jgi:hypothetical protein